MTKIRAASNAGPVGGGQFSHVGLSQTPASGEAILGYVIFEKVAFDHHAMIAHEYGDSLGTVIDTMIAEYRERGETLRSVKLEFPND